MKTWKEYGQLEKNMCKKVATNIKIVLKKSQ